MRARHEAAMELGLRWLILLSLLIFGAVVVWHQGLFEALVRSDRSYLSLVILSLFALASVFASARAWGLSRERERVWTVIERVDGAPGRLAVGPGRIRFEGQPLSGQTLLEAHWLQLVQAHGQPPASGDLDQNTLMEVMTKRVKGRHEYGWLVADLMFKLGLLGTVVGFVMMLGSLVSLDGVDLGTLQGLLLKMSGGMRVALYTTLAGLIGGMLLGLQVHMLDRAADLLLADIAEASEVLLKPALRGPAPESVAVN
jgi:hypothetical protein